MSMAPGPAPLQPGTWEAPKWPPRAQYRRRCCPARAEPGKGAGCPAGQPRATCHESSQLTISRARCTGPVVNGVHPWPITPICAQTRPSLLTLARPSRAVGTIGSAGGRPAAAIGRPPEPWVQPMPGVQSAPWVEPVPGVQSGFWVQSGSCARSRCCAQPPGCIQSLFAAQSWPSASVPDVQGGVSAQPHPLPQPGCPAPGPGPHPGPADIGPQRGLSAQPSARPARTTGMSWTTSPESGFHTRWQGRPSATRRSAASRADTVIGSACRTSQTARGAPPFRPPPSAAAGSR